MVASTAVLIARRRVFAHPAGMTTDRSAFPSSGEARQTLPGDEGRVLSESGCCRMSTAGLMWDGRTGR